jgi:hypothetical protein
MDGPVRVGGGGWGILPLLRRNKATLSIPALV